jgi:chromate reductase, NAD(P)H dehydrogenase (quinone)
MTKVLALSGSSSSRSINRQLLGVASRLAVEFGAEVDSLSVRSVNAPIFSVDIESEVPADIRNFAERLRAAELVMLASPEHNGMVPAMLKNVIDWHSRIDRAVWKAKPVILISTSPGGHGGGRVLESLGKVVPAWGAKVIGSFSLARFAQAFDAHAQALVDPARHHELLALVKAGLAATKP